MFLTNIIINPRRGKYLPKISSISSKEEMLNVSFALCGRYFSPATGFSEKGGGSVLTRILACLVRGRVWRVKFGQLKQLNNRKGWILLSKLRCD